MQIRRHAYAHRTTLNGLSSKASLIMAKCRNFDNKINANAVQEIKNGGKFVFPVTADGHRNAGSCCWPRKPPAKDIMFTNLVDTTILPSCQRVSEQLIISRDGIYMFLHIFDHFLLIFEGRIASLREKARKIKISINI
jgi:hypothetical protein